MAPTPNTTKLTPFPDDGSIRELEVSITHRCTLACNECGFFMPKQPVPQNGSPANSIIQDLNHLLSFGVTVQRLVIVGGEPTLVPEQLMAVARYAKETPNIYEVEVVSNGLSPEKVSKELLASIDRFVISMYLEGDALLDAWVTWIGEVAPHVEVIARRHESWDRWNGNERVSDEEAAKIWSSCWYRKHSITLERGRIFTCSRIPKLGHDDEGICVNALDSLQQLGDYLNAEEPLSSCATCIPMMSFAPVVPGQQPDDRLRILGPRAIKILTEKLEKK